MFAALFYLIALVLVALVCGCAALRLSLPKLPSTFTVAFFHPYCNDGGGGERVLWRMISAIQQHPDNRGQIRICVYTGDYKETKESLLNNVKKNFAIELRADIEFVFLKKRHWIEPSRYHTLRLLGQSFGAVPLVLEALRALRPHVFIDSMGYAFTYPLAALAGSTVGSYTHYPTLSADMMRKVSSRARDFNNSTRVSDSAVKTQLKLGYYRLFSLAYRFVGQWTRLVMVNSSWTRAHMIDQWALRGSRAQMLRLIYPPCNVSRLASLPLAPRDQLIISIAQFRPEKNHALQVEAFKLFLERNPTSAARLCMLGSVRDKDEDRAIVEQLQRLIGQYKLEDHVRIVCNVPNDELVREYYARALIGLHTMRDEHFGIGVVEMMAAGTIVVAHDSAGPREDIVVPYNGHATGLLASTADEYARAIERVLQMSDAQRTELQVNARQSLQRFSDETFARNVIEALDTLPSFQRALHQQ
jgi:alpha-1,2-mannosyltransferase